MKHHPTTLKYSLLAALLAASVAQATDPSPFALPQDASQEQAPAAAPSPPAASSSPFALPQAEQPASGVPQGNQPQQGAQAQQQEQVDPDAVFGMPSTTPGTATAPPVTGAQGAPAGTVPASGLGVADLLAMGTDLARQMKYDEARAALEKAAALDPANVLVLNNLGLVMRKLGRIEEATRAYTSAIQINPGFALTYKNYGILLEQNGENRRAVDAYRRYCSLAPNAPDMQKVSQRADWLAGGL